MTMFVGSPFINIAIADRPWIDRAPKAKLVIMATNMEKPLAFLFKNTSNPYISIKVQDRIKDTYHKSDTIHSSIYL